MSVQETAQEITCSKHIARKRKRFRTNRENVKSIFSRNGCDIAEVYTKSKFSPPSSTIDNAPTVLENDSSENFENYKVEDSDDTFMKKYTSDCSSPESERNSRMKKRSPASMCKDETATKKEETRIISRTSEYQAEKKRLWRMRQPYLQCQHCSYKTKDKDTFGSHIAKHDPNVERFICHTCSKTFRNKRSYRCHMRCHGGPEDVYHCTHCPFKTPSKINWQQHLAVKHKVDEAGNVLVENFVCPECGYRCMAEYQLKAHIIRKHNVDKAFKCKQCSYSSHIRFELEKHVNIKHLNIRNFVCDRCGKTSQTKSGLERHKRTHTPGLKPYKCTLCDAAYADNRKLKSHLARHENNEKPFACPLCSHSCHRRDNLQMHLKRIHKTTLDASLRSQNNGPKVAGHSPPILDSGILSSSASNEEHSVLVASSLKDFREESSNDCGSIYATGNRPASLDFAASSAEFLKYDDVCEIELESVNA